MTLTATLEEQATLEGLLGTVGQAMIRDVVLLASDVTAAMALRRLEKQAVSGAPVVERGRVVGVITQRDLLVPMLLDDAGRSQALGVAKGPNRLGGLRVSDLMSAEPVTAQADWPLVRALRTMLANGVNRLPVVDRAGRPVGVLTRDDILRMVAAGGQDAPSRSAGLEAAS
jgi:CBS domain-containing protein